jgi:hypothetical protein
VFRRQKQGGTMRQKTSKLLYDYWNDVRKGRLAPCRYEIEPAKIAMLLPETFIVECEGTQNYKIRLAGTRICEQFGRELRGTRLLDFWLPNDREALETLLHNVVADGAVAVARFSAEKEDEHRRAYFEMTLMPLIHADHTVNRMLGCLTAIDPPFWLGTTQLRAFELRTINLVWPDGQPAFLTAGKQGLATAALDTSDGNGRSTGDVRRRFRVFEGGLSDR